MSKPISTRLGASNLAIIAAVLFVISVPGCAKKDVVSQLKAMPKIDAHMHMRGNFQAAWAVYDKYHFKYFNICTRGLDIDRLNKQREISKKLIKEHPDRFAYATSFELVTRYQPGWVERVTKQLEADFNDGAIAVKVWKEIGMEMKDPQGNYTQIDDPMFKPIFDFIEKKDKTLVAHIGEPLNCWLPLDKMTVNNDRDYFSRHPQYHMFLHPEMPSHEQIMAARDRMLSQHPNLRVVGCHLGSLEYDVDKLAECLDEHPNFAVDTAARICHLQIQDREKVRRFLIKYQDRVLYGTDIIFGSLDPKGKGWSQEQAEATYQRDLEYFATDKEMTAPEVNGTFRGLALPMPVLKKLFYENAVKWYPGMVQ